MKDSNTEKIINQGRDGEEAMKQWLDDNGLSYLYINQSAKTFAKLFQYNMVKRPDFLILLDSVGLIAVDVKNKTLSGGVFTLELEKELKNVLTFERIFRIPVWYAYLGNKDGTLWYWISALKAIEVGEIKNDKSGDGFLRIKKEDFLEIEENEHIGRLYTQRITNLSKIKEKHSLYSSKVSQNQIF